MDPEEGGLWNRIRRFLEPETGKGTAALVGTSLIPGVGSAIDAADFAAGIQDRDPLRVGIAGAAMALPFVSGSQVKAMGRGIGSFVDRLREVPSTLTKGTPEMERGIAGLWVPANRQLSPGRRLRAWHGSGEDFDVFDSSFLGTGEGHAAFGHGLYFADSENVAQHYRDALGHRTILDSGNNELLDPYGSLGKWLDEGMSPEMAIQKELRQSDEFGKVYAERIAETKEDLANLPRRGIPPDPVRDPGPMGHIGGWANEYHGQPQYQEYNKLKGWLRDFEHRKEVNDNWFYDLHNMEGPSSGVRLREGGKLYEVDIAASPDAFMNWDVHPSKQEPWLRDLFPEEMRKPPGNVGVEELQTGRMQRSLSGYGFPDASKTGLHALHESYGNAPKVADALRERGVPGIKFYDGFSRGLQRGDRNYVVFNDDLIDIVGKYAEGGLVA